jgi:hypothetical protein
MTLLLDSLGALLPMTKASTRGTSWPSATASSKLLVTICSSSEGNMWFRSSCGTLQSRKEGSFHQYKYEYPNQQAEALQIRKILQPAKIPRGTSAIKHVHGAKGTSTMKEMCRIEVNLADGVSRTCESQ